MHMCVLVWIYVYHVQCSQKPREDNISNRTRVTDGVSAENQAQVLCKCRKCANSLSIPVAIISNFTLHLQDKCTLRVTTTCKKVIFQQSHSSVLLSLLYKTCLFSYLQMFYHFKQSQVFKLLSKLSWRCLSWGLVSVYLRRTPEYSKVYSIIVFYPFRILCLESFIKHHFRLL